MTGKKSELHDLLQELIEVVYATVNEGLEKGTLLPRFARYFKTKVIEFEYGDSGINKYRFESKEFQKPDWSGAGLDVWDSVEKLGKYNEVREYILNSYALERDLCELNLQRLITKVAVSQLENTKTAPTDASKYIGSFFKDLGGQQQEWRVEAQLLGLTLQPDSIQLDDSTVLRKPQPRDFEKEIPLHLAFHRSLQSPTAVLNTKTTAKSILVEREIAILCLFRVGTVRVIEYNACKDL